MKIYLKFDYVAKTVNDGTIPISDYIEYLNGISNLCKCTNALLNPGTNLEVRIDANIKKGSIINTLSMLIQGVGLFTNTQTSYSLNDIFNMLGIVGKYGTSLISLLKLKKDKKIKSVIELSDEKLKLEFEGNGDIDNAYVTVSKEVMRLYNDKSIRENLEKSVNILSKDGYDSIGFKRPNAKEYNYIDKKYY